MATLSSAIAYLRHDTTSGVQLREMDAFRGWACLGVVIYHCIVESGWGTAKGGLEVVISELLWPFHFGWLGLDVFFFLSGFLLYLKFGKSYHDNTQRPSLTAFYKRRFLRIAPAYYASIAIMLTVGMYFYGHRVKYEGIYDLLAHVFFLHNAFTEYSININGVYWTLGLEFQFYLVLPIIAGWLYGERLKVGLPAVIAAVVAFKVFLLYYCTIHNDVVLNPMYPPLSSLAWRLDQFVMGMAFCELWLRMERGKIGNPLANRAPAAFIATIAGIALMTSLILIPHYHGGVWSTKGLWTSTFRAPMISVSIAMIIFGTMHSAFFKNILANPVIEFIGVISYSLYIWHYAILAAVLDKFPVLGGQLVDGYVFATKLVFVLVVLGIGIACSVVFYLLFERPFLKRGFSFRSMFPSIRNESRP